jgi:hypothetical protein
VYGALIAPTDDAEILRLDLLVTDSAIARAYPSYLYYNPHKDDRKITLDVGAVQSDIYDAVNGRFMARGASGPTPITIAAGQAVVVVITPAGGKIEYDGSKTLSNGVVIDYRRGSASK